MIVQTPTLGLTHWGSLYSFSLPATPSPLIGLASSDYSTALFEPQLATLGNLDFLSTLFSSITLHSHPHFLLSYDDAESLIPLISEESIFCFFRLSSISLYLAQRSVPPRDCVCLVYKASLAPLTIASNNYVDRYHIPNSLVTAIGYGKSGLNLDQHKHLVQKRVRKSLIPRPRGPSYLVRHPLDLCTFKLFRLSVDVTSGAPVKQSLSFVEGPLLCFEMHGPNLDPVVERLYFELLFLSHQCLFAIIGPPCDPSLLTPFPLSEHSPLLPQPVPDDHYAPVLRSSSPIFAPDNGFQFSSAGIVFLCCVDCIDGVPCEQSLSSVAVLFLSFLFFHSADGIGGITQTIPLLCRGFPLDAFDFDSYSLFLLL